MVQSRREVRILLLGEPGVGKTSLILSLVSEEFPEEVPARSEEITIPADVTPEKVPTHIVDYSSLEQTEDQLLAEILRAHVICVIYAVDDEDTLDKVTDYWLPLVRQTLGEEHSTPVILVGNKVDLVEYSTLEAVIPIMNEFAEIETCVECSARTLKNISEMFYYAQKAILHPTAPLFNTAERDLTEACKAALGRIFKICDMDNDGLLSDTELNTFQRRCFNAPLQPQGLDDVKSIVMKNVRDGVVDDALTLDGFLFLHCLFIQRGRHETTWTVLRKFGYGDDLTLTKEYLFPPLRIPPGCSTELTHQGYQFLQVMFEKYDQDKDGCLDPEELIQLFSTCPYIPWGKQVYNTVPTDSRGYLTLQGYLSQWTLWTLLGAGRTLEYLGHLGYSYVMEEPQSAAIHVTREKRLDLQKKQTSRTAYQCHVIGPKGAGKTTFCQGLLNRNAESVSSVLESDLSKQTISPVQVYGQERYLLLCDIDVHSVTDTLLPSEAQCDVVCLVYDVADPRSFEYIGGIYLKYFAETPVPCLVVGNKSDRGEVRQQYMAQPGEFCRRHRLPPPQTVTCTGTVRRDVYLKLATMAAYPHLRSMGLLPRDNSGWMKLGLGLAAVVCGGFLLARYARFLHQ
ncbi:mitochondrial Rho GTPase-like isoform X4 [Amphibalanus amphitrite]|uniref:mitochondrial Rho GTPase-like isoform X4 n=1 Tax=Amphibalanus amphitrite TaxID=1232801 RepID=UPI001C9219A5|nr:mitochondrial Rho GTPase-like isoform X4 [Amphibalanus amphitrite]XP_043208938.1 mitochondrial Rho GTPase-like isoform X4 [Amphibalanus amphitrite]XP_043208939.1 mitochondrial Rho GTPase-like isoform X4 [Amphibalanus amphitrite]XP_043208940.1 mitochondrial Rho GTPase-like isoform X4 [Amphibalanus amphitrite]